MIAPRGRRTWARDDRGKIPGVVMPRPTVASVAVLALLVMTVLPSPARAHSVPQRFAPAPEAVLRSAPTEVRILFDGDLEPAFSAIQVTDAGGRRVDQGGTRLDPRNRRLLRVRLGTLTPGVYRVTWHILAIDGHRNEGTYVFTLASSP
jgi:copper resistance protein C